MLSIGFEKLEALAGKIKQVDPRIAVQLSGLNTCSLNAEQIKACREVAVASCNYEYQAKVSGAIPEKIQATH